MSVTIAALAAGALVGLGLGIPVGWTTNGIYRSHLDYKRAKAAMPGLRKHRWTRIRAAIAVILWSTLIVAIAVATLINTNEGAATPQPGPSSSTVGRR